VSKICKFYRSQLTTLTTHFADYSHTHSLTQHPFTHAVDEVSIDSLTQHPFTHAVDEVSIDSLTHRNLEYKYILGGECDLQ
jgi:hypothetical protein